MDFQLVVSKSSDECMDVIKKSIPYRYDTTYPMGNKYSYKLKQGNLSIISRGVGYIPVSLHIEFIKENNGKTSITGKLSKDYLSRFIMSGVQLFLFFVSLFFLIGILLGGVPLGDSPIQTILIISGVLFVSSLSYLFFRKARKREKKAIIQLITDLFPL